MKDLKVSYQRNLKSNQLIFEPDESFLLELKSKYSFELGMIEHNNIKNFLKPFIKWLNSKMEICYDISSLQPVSRIFEVKTLNIEEIRSFLIEIISATKSLEEFLLEASSIVLDPEYIFSDLDFKRFSFLYIPRNKDNKEEMQVLLENILNNINKEDKDCLIMVYGMLKECQKRDFTINDLEGILESNIKKADKEQVIYEEIIPESVDEKERNKTKFNIFGGIFKNQKVKDQDEESKFLEKVFEGYESNVNAAYINEDKTLFTVPDEEVGSTVLLTDMKIKSTGRFLRTVNGKEDIELSYLPFIIGKQERVCDYVLDTDGVSRMHLKFFEKDNELYARDLNSRNGTYVNGRKLENEENIRLYNGDSINICGISYILEI